MARNQKSYASEFKQQIVDLCNKSGKIITELSNEYGVSKGTISTWVKLLSQVQFSETETIYMYKLDLFNVLKYFYVRMIGLDT